MLCLAIFAIAQLDEYDVTLLVKQKHFVLNGTWSDHPG
jgi:hypothetical protein